jgi:hypothetical protein
MIEQFILILKSVMSVVAIVNSASTTVALYVALVVVFTADVIAVALLLWVLQ